MSAGEHDLGVLARPKKGRVLVIAPHADDEVLGCGGTLALHAEQGDEIRVVVVFDGALGLPKGSDPALREAEALAGGRHLGELEYEFWRYPEGHEPTPTELEVPIQRITDVVRSWNPSTIYAPRYDDEHVDHRTVSRAVIVAVTRQFDAALLLYEVWHGARHTTVSSVVFDVSNVWSKKIAALREHRSQLVSTDLEKLAIETARSRATQLASRGGWLSDLLPRRGFAEAFLRHGPLPSPRVGAPSIAFVAQLDEAAFRGGTEIVVGLHFAALAGLGHRVTLVVGSNEPRGDRDTIEYVDGRRELSDPPEPCSNPGLMRTIRIPRLASEPFDLALDRPRVRELVLRSIADADVVHVHHWSTLCGDLVRSIARTKPVVVTLHDFFSTCPRFFRRSPSAAIACPPRGEFANCARCVKPDAGGRSLGELELALRERAANFEAELAAARVVIAPSRAFADRIAPLLGLARERIRVVPHASPWKSTHLRSKSTTQTWRPGTPLGVMHFGNLSREKGTIDLVRALRALPKGSTKLILCGRALDESFEEEIREAAGDLELVRLGAYRSHLELRDVARSAHLAAFPSRLFETYGLVVDEALDFGLPVWVSDRGALSERIGGAGRVLPAEDPAAWTRAFEELLSRPTMLTEQRRALEREPWRHFAGTALELQRIYAELVK